MKSPNTIKEAVEQLQASIQAALPGMGVTVSINLVPQYIETIIEPVNGDDKESVKTNDISLDNLRTLLNAYVKSAGKDEALKLVKNYSNGTGKPQDIDPEDYPEVVKAMGGQELEPKGDA